LSNYYYLFLVVAAACVILHLGDVSFLQPFSIVGQCQTKGEYQALLLVFVEVWHVTVVEMVEKVLVNLLESVGMVTGVEIIVQPVTVVVNVIETEIVERVLMTRKRTQQRLKKWLLL
jgi:hypothetical protein